MRNVRSSATDVHSQINELQYLHKAARVESMDGIVCVEVTFNLRLRSLYLLCLLTAQISLLVLIAASSSLHDHSLTIWPLRVQVL